MDVFSDTLTAQCLTKEKLHNYWSSIQNMDHDIPWLHWDKDSYFKELPGKWSLSFIFLVDSNPVGYCLCSNKNNWLWIHKIVVATEFRCKGFGADMLDYAKNIAKQHSLKGIMLKTPKDNFCNISFYKKHNFYQMPSKSEYVLFSYKVDSLKVAVHQPNFLPWQGYFYKIFVSDIMVYLDNVEFTKGGYINRTKLLINGSESWLTIPVIKASSVYISDMPINERINIRKIINTIHLNYKKTVYYNLYADKIFTCINLAKNLSLTELNINLIKVILEILNINRPGLLSSTLNIPNCFKGQDRVIEIVRLLNGDTYISGAGAADYQDKCEFSNNKIKLLYSNYSSGFNSEIINGLSIIDALFRHGAERVYNEFITARKQIDNIA